MTPCERQQSGEIELYFYDELPADERLGVERHVRGCAECRHALDELGIIRAALGTRPVVDAPPEGDWTAFMRRLNQAVQIEDGLKRSSPDVWAPRPIVADRAERRATYTGYLVMAALLTLVTVSVVYVARSKPASSTDVATTGAPPETGPATQTDFGAEQTANAAFAALSEQHFERSKLVVLSLANRDAQHTPDADWAFERGLASALLSDTRIYRLTAEERGMTKLADVMKDLELVLLQTSMADRRDAGALEQIQRLIHKRDLVTKMDVGVMGS